MWSGFEKTAPAPESNRRRAVSTYRVVDRAADAWSGSQNVRFRSRVDGKGVWGSHAERGRHARCDVHVMEDRSSTRHERARPRKGASPCKLTFSAGATAPFAVPDAPFGGVGAKSIGVVTPQIARVHHANRREAVRTHWA